VRVRAALTDGTDLKTYRRGHPKMPMPTRFGHEFSGDIVAMGESVSKSAGNSVNDANKNFAVGDAIMSVHTAPCGTCFWCKNNQQELCETIMSTMILGAYADHIIIPHRILTQNTYKKPENLSYTEAAFLEPLSCVVHSITYLCHPEEPKGRLEGRTIAIIGNGAFAILHAQLLKHYGANPIIIGRNEQRNAIANSLNIPTINSREENPLDAVLARTENRGADAVIECTGNAEVWQEAPQLARRGGTVSFFGGLPSSTQVAFQASLIHYDEIRLIGPFHLTPKSVRIAYELLRDRKIDVASLISGTFPLDDIADVFECLDRGEGLKYAIEP